MTEKVKIWKTNYSIELPKRTMDALRKTYPNKTAMVRFNTDFELSELDEGESVCWGDGEHFIFVLKSNP